MLRTTPAPRPLAAGSLLLALAVLPACSGAGDTPLLPQGEASAEPISEVAEHGGELCPPTLPTAPDAFGIGTEEPAPAAPSVPTPEDGAVCRYELREAGSDEDAFEWSLSGAPVRVPTADLEELTGQLASLTPADPELGCEGDLGRRWMLVTVSGEDLTGVVVDDFGCGSARMTDEPFETVAGEASQEGTVPGVLDAPDGLLSTMIGVWSND